MSTVRTENLSNVANTKPPAVTLGEFVQARFSFNQTTPAVNDSFNVSSMTDNGAGDMTCNMATAFGNAHYASVGTSNGASGGIGIVVGDMTAAAATVAPTASAYRMCSLTGTFGGVDREYSKGILVGDYA